MTLLSVLPEFTVEYIRLHVNLYRNKLNNKVISVKRKYKRRNMNKNLKKVERLLANDPKSPHGGEVIVRFDSGETHEFHSHDTEIDDTKLVIKKTCSDGVMWFDGEKIEAVWVHQNTLPSE